MLLMIASNRSTGKRGQILIGELSGRFARAGVKVNRAAADLRPRHVDIAAILLQHAGGGPVDVAEHRVADAAGEQRDGRTAAADGGQELGQRPFVAPRRRQHVDHARNCAGKQPRQPRGLQQFHQAGPLGDAGPGSKRAAQLARIGKQAEQNVAVKPIVALSRWPVGRVHRHAEWLDELAVLHAGGARRFARAAIEAQLEMPAHAVVELELAIGHAAHEIDAAARALVLVARFDVRRTRGRAQAAVDAVEQQLVVERSAGIGGECRVIFLSSVTYSYFTTESTEDTDANAIRFACLLVLSVSLW